MTQPKVQVEQSQLDKSIEILTLAAMGAYLVFIFISYAKLPDQIPTHFGPTGEPDGWSSKFSLFMLPFIALAINILLTVMNKHPHTFNYPVKITPENAAFHYEKGRSLLTRIKATIVFMFFYISWRTVAIVEGRASGLGQWFILIILLATFIPIILYFVDIVKERKKP